MKKLSKYSTNFFFLIINFSILISLFLLGNEGPLIHLDFADHYLDKSQRLANDFKQLKIPGIDYSVFNGWNATYGSIPINHIMIFFNIFFSPYASAHTFIFLTDILVYFGFYFTLRNYFKIDIFISTIITLIIFFLLLITNENYIVNQYTLFGFLLSINYLLTKKDNKFYLGLFFLIIYCSFSYPPYNIPIAPFFHLIFILFFFYKDKKTLKRLIKWFFVIWLAYFFYHFSLIISLLENYQFSNRYIWETIDREKIIENIKISKNIIYIPVLVIIYIVSKKKLLNIIFSIIIIYLPEIITLINIENNFIISRLAYSSPLVLVFIIISNLVNSQQDIEDIFQPLINFNFLYKFSFLFIIIFIFKFFTIFNQGYNAGFLYVDDFKYPEPKNNYRIVTLNNHCFETIFNSSQVLINGYKTLDGTSVFYPIKFANKVKNVKKKYDSCIEPQKFKYWNNRVFFTNDEFLKNQNLLNFFIDNNVRIIRSRNKIINENLNLLGQFKFYNTSMIRYKLNEIDKFKNFLDKYVNNFEKKKVDVYIYEIKNWKKIDIKYNLKQDKYFYLKIINFYIFIFFVIIILTLKMFKRNYLNRL